MTINVEQKLAGILIPVFALRRGDDLGIGDTASVEDAILFCERNQLGVLQLLPINETGGDNSPYNAISSIALDPAFLDVSPDAVPFVDQQYYQKLLEEKNIKDLRDGSVKYPAVKALKKTLLINAFENFKTKGDRVSLDRFAKFKVANKNWLESYAVFRTLVSEHDGDARWPLWDKALQDYETAKKWIADSEHKARIADECEFWSFVQFIAFDQWQAVKQLATDHGVALMGDIPFGVSRYSVDVWANKNLFDLDWSGGAPPERFFQADPFTRNWGQNWGLPVYNWANHKSDDFHWWKERVTHVSAVFHYFRIDHVLGFFRIYSFPWIPERNHEFEPLTLTEAQNITGGKLPHFIPRDDETEENAQLNAGEGESLLHMILDAAQSTGVVAEDLGMVPPYVRPLLQQMGIPGFYIPPFERVEEDRSYKPASDIPKLSLATYGTHDHQPIASLYEGLVKSWKGEDGHNGWLEIQRLMVFLGLDPEQPPTEFNGKLLERFFQVLLSSPAWLVVMMVTDMLGTTQRFNEPGLSGDYNWSQRLEYSLSEYEKKEPYAGYLKTFKQYVNESGRAPVKKMPASVLSSP